MCLHHSPTKTELGRLPQLRHTRISVIIQYRKLKHSADDAVLNVLNDLLDLGPDHRFFGFPFWYDKLTGFGLLLEVGLKLLHRVQTYPYSNQSRPGQFPQLLRKINIGV